MYFLGVGIIRITAYKVFPAELGLTPIIIDRIELGKGNVQWSDFLILMNFYGKDFSFEMEKIHTRSEEHPFPRHSEGHCPEEFTPFLRHSEELCSEESITT